jgi:hypothetical protein
MNEHPRTAAWLILSAALWAFLTIEGQSVMLTAGQWLALYLASAAVAGLSVLIISGGEGGCADAAASRGPAETSGSDEIRPTAPASPMADRGGSP